MDGNQKPQTSGTTPIGIQAPVNNPPSLVEPSQPTLPSPVVSVDISHAPAKTEVLASQPELPQPVAVMPEPINLQPANPPSAAAELVQPPLPPSPAVAPQAQVAPATDDGAMPEGGFYHADTGLAPVVSEQSAVNHPAAAQPDEEPVSWISSGEAIQAHSQSWKVKMTALSVVVGVIVYAITRDFVSSGAVAFAGILFGFLGARKPQPLQYQVGRDGIIIGRRPFSYTEFRAFSLVNDGPALTINLMPLKRFSPILSVHADPELHDKIVAILSNHLPMEAHKRDAIDAILSKARF